jgi:hypothetical protein
MGWPDELDHFFQKPGDSSSSSVPGTSTTPEVLEAIRVLADTLTTTLEGLARDVATLRGRQGAHGNATETDAETDPVAGRTQGAGERHILAEHLGCGGTRGAASRGRGKDLPETARPLALKV